MKQLHSQLLLLLIGVLGTFTANGQYQFSEDCTGALSLCNGRYVFPYSFDGNGSINELDTIPTCLSGGEHNSAWYKLSIDAPGYLVFSIEPLGPNDDYDFALFDITGGTCADVNDTTLVRCSYAWSAGIATGLSSTDTLTSAGLNDEPFLQWLAVDSGDVLTLVVTNSSPFGYGYWLDFTASTASIVSREPLYVADKFMAICDNFLYGEFYFNQPITSQSISNNFSEIVLTDNTGANLPISNITFDTIANKMAFVCPKPTYVIDSVSVQYQLGSDGNTVQSGCNSQYLPIGVDTFKYLFNHIGAGGFTASNIGRTYTMMANTQNVPFVNWYVNGSLVVRQQASLPFVTNLTAGQSYTVCMAAKLGCNNDSTCQTFMVAGIDDVEEFGEISLFPNPSDHMVTIRAPFNIDELELFDLHGKVVRRSVPTSNTCTVITDGIPQGIYIAKLKANGNIYTKKVIVAR